MQPVSDVTFNANSMYQNKVIVDTWEVELSMGKEGMTAISKQHHVEQIRVTNVCSVLFYRDQCVLASKDLRLMVEDKGSVGKLRRRMKASRHDLNLDRTVIGTTVMYHTNTGRESVAHSIIRNLVKNNDHGREVMGWREAMCALGIIDTPGICSSLGDNGNEDIVYCNPDEGEVPIRKKKTARGGKKKKKKSSPKHVSESGGEEEEDVVPQTVKLKPGKVIRIKQWRLAYLNISDLRKHTARKFRGLAEMMETHRLHGVALGEMRVENADLFTVYQEQYKGLTLLVDPCLTKNTEGVQGGLSGNAGGLGFLVRSELLDQGLISCITSVSSSGFYGKESVCFVEIKVGTSTVKWVNAYIRSRGGAEEKCYEWDKVQTVLKIKGNKMIMGDINASIVYSRPTELWRKEGLGFTTAQSNATIKRTAKRLREELAQASITDISARGEHIWVPTRCPVGGPNNKLDVIMVSDALMKTQKARLESIITPTAEPDDDGGDSEPLVISDHKMLIMTMRANCSLTVGAYKEKETYKLQRLLNSHRIQRIFKERMSVQAAKSMDNMDQGESLDSINCMLTQGIKECAVSTVGVKSFRKASSQRIITSKPDVARARRDLADSRREVKSAAEEADQLKKETLRMGKISDEGRREEKARILRQLDEKSVYRQKQVNLKSKKLRNQ